MLGGCRSAADRAGHHAADAAGAARFSCGCASAGDLAPGTATAGRAAVEVTARTDRSRRGALLHILHLRSGGFGDVYRPATNHCATCRTGRQFREGHPYRHKLCSLCLWGSHAGPCACYSTPVTIETQTIGKAAMQLTVFSARVFQIVADSPHIRGHLSRIETECHRFA